MFTGLIEEIGIVKSIIRSGSGINITILSEIVISDCKVGDSITIDGACQTVTELGDGWITVFTSKITCDLTTLGNLYIGKKVNLERALFPSSRMGGHIVQGHIDCKGKVRSKNEDKNGVGIEISVPVKILKYIVDKGSIAIDGVSLTVIQLTDSSFKIFIIPETIRNTTLSEKSLGDEVNIEVDILAKYVERMIMGKVEEKKDEILKEKLIREGFI